MLLPLAATAADEINIKDEKNKPRFIVKRSPEN
jgi:hypothetical protein